ncbi:MAG: hypothetical protein HOV80_16890 [Polyangiaceae bacterium]|nr:hypothetical protein [Polyangiaceae bacterium]
MRKSAWLVVLFWVLAIALYLAPRLSGLDLDPPREVYRGWLGAELMVEPPAKAHEARNWALFGAFKINEADNYQFWRAQSPAWVYPLALSFKTFGVSYATLRTTATVLGLAGLLGIVLFAHRRFGARGAAVAAVIYATEQFGIFFGRSGILEPIVAGWCMLGFCFLDRAFERAIWLGPALLMLVVAMATKLAALPAVPVFVVFGAIAVLRAPGTEHKGRFRLILLGAIVLAIVALGIYAASPAYVRTLVWNFQHMLFAKEGGTELDLEALDDEELGASLGQVAKRLDRLWWMFPHTIVGAGLELGRQGWLVARRRASLRELMPVAYFFCFVAGVLIPRHPGNRFLMLMALPLALLTLQFTFAAAKWLEERLPKVGRWAPIGFAVVFAGWGLGTFGYARVRYKHDIKDSAALLRKHIGDRPDAVVIGLWSAPVVLETPYKHYYVKSTFNATPEALLSLAPTHTVLLGGDYTRTILREHWPEALDRATPLATFSIRDNPLTLSEIPPVAVVRLKRSLGIRPNFLFGP